MRIVDRVARLEIIAGGRDDHRRRLETDAAAFVEEINRLAERHRGPPSTLADFYAAIRQSGDAFLITTFIGEHHAHS